MFQTAKSKLASLNPLRSEGKYSPRRNSSHRVYSGKIIFDLNNEDVLNVGTGFRNAPLAVWLKDQGFDYNCHKDLGSNLELSNFSRLIKNIKVIRCVKNSTTLRTN